MIDQTKISILESLSLRAAHVALSATNNDVLTAVSMRCALNEQHPIGNESLSHTSLSIAGFTHGTGGTWIAPEDMSYVVVHV